MVRAGPRRLVARDAGGARGPRRRRGRRHRLERSDARPGRARRRGRGDPPRDPLERRPDGRGVRRDRGAGRPRAADRAHRQPGADRLHRAEAAVAAQARAGGVRRGSRGSCSPRTTCASGCAASTRSTWPTRRGRCCSTSRGGAGPTRCSTRSRSTARGCRALLESPEVSGTTPDGVPVAAGAGDQAAGALGVGVDRPGPLSVALGTSGVVFAALPAFAADEQRACTRSATPCRAAGTRWA